MRGRWPRFTRDGLLFFVGLAGIINETLRENAERPTLLILFAAMCGLPAFLRTDERIKPPDVPPPADTEAGPT